ncbi:collagen-like protein [Candidatus Latescibacterota bacterium]
MRALTIVCIIACVALVGCFEGPTGSQGEQGLQGEKGEHGEPGKDGESLEIIDITGVLVAGNMLTDGEYKYWDIELPDISKTYFISIVLSAGGETAWWNPSTWGYAYYDNKSFARIYNEERWVEAGYEYMISIAY